MREVRRLYSPAAGMVYSLRELSTGEHGGALSGAEGFAVGAQGLLMRAYYRLLPAVDILSPADGALVAADEGGFRLRTGDGTEILVTLPGGAEYFLEAGQLARAGEQVCRVSRDDFAAGKAGVAVCFCDSSQVTELNVLTGARRAAAPAAEYSPQPWKGT